MFAKVNFLSTCAARITCAVWLTAACFSQAAPPIRQARSPEEDAEFWRSKGNDFFKFGDYVKAKQCYTSSIAAQPSAAAFANRALVCTKVKEWTQAERDCSQVRLQLRDSSMRSLSLRRSCCSELMILHIASTLHAQRCPT